MARRGANRRGSGRKKRPAPPHAFKPGTNSVNGEIHRRGPDILPRKQVVATLLGASAGDNLQRRGGPAEPRDSARSGAAAAEPGRRRVRRGAGGGRAVTTIGPGDMVGKSDPGSLDTGSTNHDRDQG